jgi:PAS domain S-box-containing protein
VGDLSAPGGETAEMTPATDRWRLALEAGAIGVWEWDLTADVLEWSPRAGEIAGLDHGGRGSLEAFLERVHPDDRSTVRAGVETRRHRPEPQRFEFRLGSTDGPVTWVECAATVVTDSLGAPHAMVGTMVDVTDRRETEVALEQLFRDEQRARVESEASRERLQFLVSAAREVRSVLDPVVVRRTAVDLVVSHLAEWALILDPGGVTVEAAAGSGLADTDRRQGALCLAHPHEAISQVVATASPQLSAGAVTLAPVRVGEGSPIRLEASSIVAVPLVLGTDRVGILVAGHHRLGRPYQAEELELFTQYADSVAATLVKATLFAERSAIARALQQSLLPATLPEIPGVDVGTSYLPVGEGLVVGGDFYDLFRVAEGRYAFAIGDVSGKGSEAAAVTALVRHSIRAYAEMHEDPADVLVAVNDAVRIHGPSQRYCTAALGVLTLGDPVEVALAVGGHPLPIVVRADGSTEKAGAPGTLLGMFTDVTMVTRRVRLDPADMIVLYTDGVIDARCAGASFGEERLRALVKTLSGEPASTVSAAIGAAVADYQDVPTDDLAVLVLRRSG